MRVLRDLPVTTATARRLTPAVLLIACAILAVATFVSSTPSACSGCHGAPQRELAATAHRGVDCYACHLEAGMLSYPAFKAREVGTMYPASLVAGGKAGGATTGVSRSRCLRCHREILEGVTEAKGMRIRHRSCAPSGESCSRCHSAVAHGKATRWIREPVMDDCIGCHTQVGATTRCDACHASKSTATRLQTGPWAVTHGPQWKSQHGMGDLRGCRTCHPEGKCVKCHGTPLPHKQGFTNDHGRAAKLPEAKCDQCHDRKQFCDGCHGFPMPHGDGFRKEHLTITESRDDERCLRCHEQVDCDACHKAHAHPGRTDGTLNERLKNLGGGR